jgi:hypothetical protein
MNESDIINDKHVVSIELDEIRKADVTWAEIRRRKSTQ